MRFRLSLLTTWLLVGLGVAASKPDTVALGPWLVLKASAGTPGHEVKIRPLLVDGQTREYTTGQRNDVTDRVFVIRRADRVNDSLPEESGKPLRWTWQLGGWISVNRMTGHISRLNLPAFDPQTSEASWYRDYAAYCGVSDDGSQGYMMVFQVGRRKPVLKKEQAGLSCAAPQWERDPIRVTFATSDGAKVNFVIRRAGAEMLPEENAPEENSTPSD